MLVSSQSAGLSETISVCVFQSLRSYRRLFFLSRRELWRNMLTNEEHYGLLAIEPEPSPAHLIQLDGDTAGA